MCLPGIYVLLLYCHVPILLGEENILFFIKLVVLIVTTNCTLILALHPLEPYFCEMSAKSAFLLVQYTESRDGNGI